MRWLSNREAQTLPGNAGKLMGTTQCQGRPKRGSWLSGAVRATVTPVSQSWSPETVRDTVTHISQSWSLGRSGPWDLPLPTLVEVYFIGLCVPWPLACVMG